MLNGVTLVKKKSSTTKKKGQNPDHALQLPKLNRVEGQIVGIKKMIEERRYCPDIIQQVRATRKALTSIELTLLESHLNCCVKKAVASQIKDDLEQKIQEIVKIFKSAESQGLEF